jgi:hypothetical protein
MWRTRILTFVFLVLSAIPLSTAQQPGWDIQGAQEVNQELRRLSTQDQQGIAHRLGEKSTDLRAVRIETPSNPLFLVQGVGTNFNCSPTGNCSFWILSSYYRILRKTIAQTAKVQSSSHYGLPDVITAMHGSAFESDLSLWQFNGKLYLRAGCATAAFGDASGDGDPTWYDHPRITPRACTPVH